MTLNHITVLNCEVELNCDDAKLRSEDVTMNCNNGDEKSKREVELNGDTGKDVTGNHDAKDEELYAKLDNEDKLNCHNREDVPGRKVELNCDNVTLNHSTKLDAKLTKEDELNCDNGEDKSKSEV